MSKLGDSFLVLLYTHKSESIVEYVHFHPVISHSILHEYTKYMKKVNPAWKSLPGMLWTSVPTLDC